MRRRHQRALAVSVTLPDKAVNHSAANQSALTGRFSSDPAVSSPYWNCDISDSLPAAGLPRVVVIIPWRSDNLAQAEMSTATTVKNVAPKPCVLLRRAIFCISVTLLLN